MSVENFAVGKSSKSPFTKAVKNIRSLIDKGQVEVQEPKKNKIKREDPSVTSKVKPQRRQKEKTTGSVVYLSHLPQGFEEKGIRSYMEQFGKVTGVKLVRSQKTGRSRGFAFVEFVERDVAEIVVQTMNNYLMFKRLVKAELLKPPNDGANALQVFDSAPIKPENCLTARRRQAYLRKRDKVQDKKSEQKMDAQTRKSLRRLQKKLEARGISFQMKASKHAWRPVVGKTPSIAAAPKGQDSSLVLVHDESDMEIDFSVPHGLPVTQWAQRT